MILQILEKFGTAAKAFSVNISVKQDILYFLLFEEIYLLDSIGVSAGHLEFDVVEKSLRSFQNLGVGALRLRDCSFLINRHLNNKNVN